MNRTMRDTLQLVSEIRIIVESMNPFDDFFRVEVGKHVSRKRNSAVPITDEAVRRVASHFIRRFERFEGAIHDALFARVSTLRVDGGIAITAKACSWVPNRRLGHIIRIERPVPITIMTRLV